MSDPIRPTIRPIRPFHSPIRLSEMQTEAQRLLDYINGINDIGGEFMFTVDVPYVPFEDAPMVLAQAATVGDGGLTQAASTQKANYLLKACQEISTLVGDSESAERLIDPLGGVAVYYYQHLKLEPDMSGASTSILKEPKHGKISYLTANVDWPMYHYEPAPGYLGKDQVSFMATYRGKTYKVVVDLLVEYVSDGNAPQCPKPTLIKLNSLPPPDSLVYDSGPINIGIAALDGGTITGQARIAN